MREHESWFCGVDEWVYMNLHTLVAVECVDWGVVFVAWIINLHACASKYLRDVHTVVCALTLLLVLVAAVERGAEEAAVDGGLVHNERVLLVVPCIMGL